MRQTVVFNFEFQSKLNSWFTISSLAKDKDELGGISVPTDQEILAGLSNRSWLEMESVPVTANLREGSKEATRKLNRNLLLEIRQATAAIFRPMKGKNWRILFALMRIGTLVKIGSALLLKTQMKMIISHYQLIVSPL